MPFHKFSLGEAGWQVVGKEQLLNNPHLEVMRLSFTSPSRPEPFEWMVTHRKGAVVIAAQTTAGDYLLVRQERAPIQATIWEFPAGQIEERAEQSEELIRATGERELREETGYEPSADSEVTSLGFFFPSPGFTDEHSHLLRITHVAPGAAGMDLDDNEAISEVRAVSPAELKRMVAEGEINDANTLATVARLLTRGLL